MTKTRTIVCAVAMLAVLLVVGACSSGSSSTKGTTSGGAVATNGAGSTKTTKGGGSDSAFCRKVKSYEDESSDNLSVKDTIKALKDLKSSAPSEIKDDLQTVIDFTEKLANVDTNDPEALASAYSNLDTDKLSSASDNLDQYVEKKCGITLSS